MSYVGLSLFFSIVRVLFTLLGAYLRKLFSKVIGRDKKFDRFLEENKKEFILSQEFISIVVGLASWIIIVVIVMLIIENINDGLFDFLFT